MLPEQTLIERLLADARVEDFQENLVFRTQILNKPEAAQTLMVIMANADRQTIGQRAQQMLTLFDASALPALAAGLTRPGALWRYDLLNILWAIISVYETDEIPALLASVQAQVMALFEDATPIMLEFEDPVEVEFIYRVRDQAYAFIQRLRDPRFDESYFRMLDDAGRDQEIRGLRSQISAGIA